MLRDQHREKLPHFFFFFFLALTVEPICFGNAEIDAAVFFKGVGRSFQICVAVKGVDYWPGSVFTFTDSFSPVYSSSLGQSRVLHVVRLSKRLGSKSNLLIKHRFCRFYWLLYFTKRIQAISNLNNYPFMYNLQFTTVLWRRLNILNTLSSARAPDNVLLALFSKIGLTDLCIFWWTSTCWVCTFIGWVF